MTNTIKYRIQFFLLIAFFLSSHIARSQGTAPKLSCISVTPGGSVVLNWQSPADPCNSFHGYYLYASKNKNGPYTLLDSVLVLAQNSYTHSTANAGINPWYYYLISKYDCGGKPYLSTDTLASMKIDVINNNSGAAQIFWNKPFSGIKPGTSSFFLIYREYPAGIWSLIDSTKANFYKDTIVSICSNTQINYQIKLRDPNGCFSSSSIFGGLFKDVMPAAIPIIDTVSVNPLSGYAGIGWNLNPSLDTKAYVIYSYINGIWSPTDTVSGRMSTYFMGSTPPYDASSGSKIFKVAAMDICGNMSPAILVFNTIFLSSTFDLCSRSSKLSWNAYKNAGGNVSYYAVFYSENGGSIKLAGKTNSTDFTHTGLKTGVTYCYFVRAYINGLSKTSSSNAVCIFNSGMPPPNFLYLKTASVEMHNQVRIEFYADTSVNVGGYRIRRSDNAKGPFSEIAKIPGSKNPIIVFTDKTAITNKEEYFYFVSAYDNCGFNLLTSNTGHLIRTLATGNSDLTNTIKWSDYEKWSGLVETYSVYRSIDGIWDQKPIAVLNSGTNSYLDSANIKTENQGMICYRVRADEGNGNSYNFNAYSYSDSSCAQQSPAFYVPNAFCPNGSNPIFLPISSFIDSRDYNMVIFNSWGTLIFQSTNPEIGWDGTSEGKPSPQGAYTYIIQMRGTNGVKYDKKGMLSLIR